MVHPICPREGAPEVPQNNQEKIEKLNRVIAATELNLIRSPLSRKERETRGDLINEERKVRMDLRSQQRSDLSNR